jgi:hypothetical protein
MNRTQTLQLLRSYQEKGLSLIPLKRRSKRPLVKWKTYQLTNEDLLKYLSQGVNWAIRCDEHFHALDFDSPDTYRKFIQEKDDVLKGAPVVRTGRGYHIWFKPKEPVKSFDMDGIEVKGLKRLVVVPPSIHPHGAEYVFETPLNGSLPVIDVNELIGSRITETPKKQTSTQANCSQHTTLPIATTAEQEEFRSLFTMLGVFPGENPTWCPFHPDREGSGGSAPQKSLSVDWEKCVFKCHSPRCGEHGGINRLIVLALGKEVCPSYPLADSITTNDSDIPVPAPPAWDTWETVSPPTRRCGMPIHLRHRKDKRRQRMVSLLDGRWNCAVCGPYLKKKWLEHLYPIFTEAEHIYLTTLPSKKEWGTLYKRLQRLKADFARLELESGELVVFSNRNANGVELPQSIRNGVLKVAMDAATFRHKPITTSRGWKLPEKKDEGEESQWERVGGLPITIDEAREVVKELGLKPVDLNLRFVPNALDAFEVMLPESWLEDDEKGFKVFVKWLSHGPVKAPVNAAKKEVLEMCRV